jgi:Orthopoxvirus protein of unknown function (DUF830).
MDEIDKVKVCVVFSKENSFPSILLRWFTWSKFSHVEVILSNGNTIAATAKHGVCLVKSSDSSKKFVKKFIYLSKFEYFKFEGFLLSQIGKPYDWTGVFGFLPRLRWQDDGAWFCSELVAAAFTCAGKPLTIKDSWRVTPEDLLDSIALFDEV